MALITDWETKLPLPLYELNLPGWKTTKTVRVVRDDLRADIIPIDRCGREKMIVTAIYTGPVTCKCGRTDLTPTETLTKHIIDVPFLGQPVEVVIERQRFRCRCGKKPIQEPPFVDKEHKMTSRCRAWIEDELITRPVDDIAAMAGMSPPLVRVIFKKLIRDLMLGYRYTAPFLLGIDEKTIDGKKCIVLTDLGRKRCILDVLPNMKPRTLISWLEKLENRSAVEVVAIDCCLSYRWAARRMLPQALIVADKWHVMKLAAPNLRNRKTSAVLAKWHQIWDGDRSREEAEREFDAWCGSLSGSSRIAFARILRVYENWRDEILNYFPTRITNGRTERANRHIKRIVSTIGGGYETVRARAIFSHIRPHRDRIRCVMCRGFFEHKHLGVSGCSDEYVLEYACEKCSPSSFAPPESSAIWKPALSWTSRLDPVESAQSEDKFKRTAERFHRWCAATPDWQELARRVCEAPTVLSISASPA